MRIHAYVLAADPDFVEASVRSYYDLVDRIIVSYDENSAGWTGFPVDVSECLTRLKAIDSAGKMCFAPGDFAKKSGHPQQSETNQRQIALDLASENADWVLQLDTDEVIGDQEVFLSCLRQADEVGAISMDYPARWLYRQLGGCRYLEWCTRFWGVSAGYPGPVAVRSGTKLKWARQCEGEVFRVDFRWTNTGGTPLEGRPIHRAIHPNAGIFHFSWTRAEEGLRTKFSSWGHANDRDWQPELQRWVWSGKHPILATLKSPLQRGDWYGKHLRIVTVPGASFEER